MTTTIFLVRHAAHELGDGTLCGRTPGVRLAAAGHRQARRVGERLAGEELARVYTSPMERCRQTADAVAARAGIDVALEPGFDEIDFGRWSGRRFPELADDPGWRRWNEQRADAETPGGETMRMVQSRAIAALRNVALGHAEERVAVVSHADVIKAMLMEMLGMPLSAHDRIDIAVGSVSAVVLWDGGGKVLSINEPVLRI